MDKIMGTLFLLILSSKLFGQANSQAKPFTLQGQITNAYKKQFYLTYQTVDKVISADTIRLDAAGRFHLQSSKLNEPVAAKLEGIRLYLAPGYNLSLTADGTDRLSLFKSKTISGFGSQPNQYLFLIDSLQISRYGEVDFYDLEEGAAVKHIQYLYELRDSVTAVVFHNNRKSDPFHLYYKNLSRLDNTFQKLYMLVAYLNINVGDYQRYPSFIKTHFNNLHPDSLLRDEYLISPYFKELMEEQYVNYLVQIDYKRDSSLRKRKDYKLEKINKTFSGRLKEYVLYSRIKASLAFDSRTFLQLNENKARFEPYVLFIKNPAYQKDLQKRLAFVESELKRTQAGSHAPAFALESNKGEVYSLSQFLGKVIYLDLWASWCHPCREETPYLKALQEKYKDRNDVVFIGISTDKDREKWLKAIEEDKPTWLQLIDKDNIVSKAYVANAIPQFVLIDKKGKIASFDAPRPSSSVELEKLLIRELTKDDAGR